MTQRSDETPDAGSFTEGSPPRDLSILDYRGLMSRVGDKVEIVDEVLRIIRESLPDHIAQCRIALENRNIPEMRQVAHTIKGSAGTAGAEIVADRASRISAAIRNEETNPNVLEPLLGELDRAILQFLDYLQKDDTL